jgi:tetratricopeptide (TPR) repeat protein
LQAARRLNELFEATGRGPERLAILERLATIEPIASDRRGALGQAATLAAALGTGDKAIALWERRLEADAKDLEALGGLLGVLETQKRWAELVAGLRRRVTLEGPPHQKRADLIRIASLQAGELENRADAIATWRELRASQGEDDETTDALAKLLEDEGKWTDLVDLLETAARRSSSRWIDAGARLGDLARDRLKDTERAAAAYDHVLKVSPKHEAARAGLLTLIEARLERAASPAARATILVDQARMEEETSAQDAAQRSLERALMFTPDRVELDAELLRLAGATNSWGRVAEVFDAAAAASSNPSRAADLRLRVGEIDETHLSDLTKAVQAYRAAVVAAGKPAAVEALARTAKKSEAGPAAAEAVAAAADALERRGERNEAAQMLELLVELQRPVGGQVLAGTLARLTVLRPGSLAVMREIAELEVTAGGGDRPLAAVQQLFEEASRQLARATPTPDADTHARWALEALVKLHTAAGRRGQVVDLLLAGARLPFDASTLKDLRKRAGSAALESGDERRAADLYRAAIEEDPSNLGAIQALIPLTKREDQLPELLMLRRRELALTEDPGARLWLRLEVSRIAGLIEERSDRVEMLVANLEQQPGHDASIAALVDLLSARTLYSRLAELLASQAIKLEKATEGARAARLWERVAEISEKHLDDTNRALESYRKAASHDPIPATLDALARLHTSRSEHGPAATWLERRLLLPPDGASRTDLVLRLARAYLEAKQPQRAMAALDAGLTAEPSSRPILDLLLEVYRNEGAWDLLGRRLVAVCQTLTDPDALIKYAAEVADIFGTRLGTPDLAIPVLERAVKIAPQDRGLKTTLAEGLGTAGRYDESRALFEELIAGYGRRRSPERADLSRKLAAVAHKNGDVALALEQLDIASKLDLGRPSLLATLASVAREAGKLEQAEQAYRALLLLVRRRSSDDPETPLAAEVLYELSRLATTRGDEVQARELVESAVESATQHVAEARRLERLLLQRKDTDLLLRILDARLKVAETAAEKGDILAMRARGAAMVGKSDEALTTWLAALAETPSSIAMQKEAKDFASANERLPAYIEGVSKMIGGRRRREDWTAHADLVLQLAGLLEESGDLRRASDFYLQLTEQGERVVEAWAAVVGLAGKLNDEPLQAKALEKLAGLSGAGAADLKADALYRVAELQLSKPQTLTAGRETLTRAFALEPRFEAAAELLGRADQIQSLDDAAFAQYEELAGQSGNAHTLLGFFERRARRAGATLMQDREAVNLALRLEEGARAEALLIGAVDRAAAEVGGLAGAAWALFSLVERRIAARDGKKAIEWLRQAVQLGDVARVRALGLELATAVEKKDPESAAETYRLLLEQDPGDRAAWEPLLQLHRRLGDDAAVTELVTRLVSSLVERDDRNNVRMTFVSYLVDHDRRDEAITVLNEVIFDDPNHVEATQQLGDLLERAGRKDELAELLTRQLEDARERGAREVVVALSLRIGQSASPADAAAIYRRALQIAPDDRTVLHALAGCVDAERDGVAPRAEVLEQLLAAAEAHEAPAIALEIAGLRMSLEDEEAAERALVAARHLAPQDVALRERLEQHYREAEDHAKLAGFLSTAAEEVQTDRAVAMLREAAEIHRDFLLEIPKAAACLAHARRLAPSDADLLQSLVSTLLLAGDRDGAAAELGNALETGTWPKKDKIALLRQRAELNRATRNTGAAVADLEAVFTLVGDEVRPELVALLEEHLQSLAGGADPQAESETFMRLASVVEQGADIERLRTILETWITTHPDDTAALRKLVALETGVENWPGMIKAAMQLFPREGGDSRVDLALAIADAGERIGKPTAGIPPLVLLRKNLPEERRVLERLEKLYVATNSHGPLAELLQSEAARTADPAVRAMLLVRIGRLYLEEIDQPAAAIEPLQQAAAALPGDVDVACLLGDALTRNGQFEEAGQILQAPLADAKKKRSRTLPALLRQMAHLASATGDADAQIAWLTEAFDADRKNGRSAFELAHAATTLGRFELALKVLRHISLMDDPSPMTRAGATFEQARIALHLGNPGQAEMWTKKALREDPSLTAAQEFLAQLLAAKKG